MIFTTYQDFGSQTPTRRDVSFRIKFGSYIQRAPNITTIPGGDHPFPFVNGSAKQLIIRRPSGSGVKRRGMMMLVVWGRRQPTQPTTNSRRYHPASQKLSYVHQKPNIINLTLLGTNISHSKGTFEDDFPFLFSRWDMLEGKFQSFITDEPCPAFSIFTLPIPFAGLAACRRGLVPYVGGVDGNGPEATSTTQNAGRMGWDGRDTFVDRELQEP